MQFGDEHYIRISKKDSGELIEIHEDYVRIRENEKKLMVFNIKAPIFETEDIERFFEGFNSSEKLMVNICDTGNFPVSFRGLIDGKEKNFSQNMDHKLLLLEEARCQVKKEVKRVKKCMPRDENYDKYANF